ncbi:unnamed protein product, partial [Cyprideis torosa]
MPLSEKDRLFFSYSYRYKLTTQKKMSRLEFLRAAAIEWCFPLMTSRLQQKQTSKRLQMTIRHCLDIPMEEPAPHGQQNDTSKQRCLKSVSVKEQEQGVKEKALMRCDVEDQVKKNPVMMRYSGVCEKDDQLKKIDVKQHGVENQAVHVKQHGVDNQAVHVKQHGVDNQAVHVKEDGVENQAA